jgi:hypothetical protein
MNILIRLPKGILSLFIAKDRENFERGRKCSLFFAMKRDKSHPFWKPDLNAVLNYNNWAIKAKIMMMYGRTQIENGVLNMANLI